jgi:hypothetical protein
MGWIETILSTITAASTVVALTALMLEQRQSRRDTKARDERDRIARHRGQAANVTGWIERDRVNDGLENLTGVVSNASELAIYEVTAEVVDGAGRRLGNEAECETAYAHAVAPGRQQVLNEWFAVHVKAGSRVRMRLLFTDASGTRWQRIDGELIET